MGKIYIIGLGPGNIDSLTLGAVERIHSGDKNFLRTKKHPTVEYFHEKEIPYESYDWIYDSEEDFENVYKKIVDELIGESKDEKSINYFVPGNPMIAENTVKMLLERGIETEIIGGMSFIEPMLQIVERDPIDGLKIVDGSVFDDLMIDINVDTIITQVYNRRILSNIKLKLSEIYGDEYKIWLIQGAGIKNIEEKHNIPIYALDRIEKVDSLTSIYVEKMKKDNKVFDFNDLMGIMRVLRGIDGCPWDIKQTHKSLRQCLIEEAYEVVDAIDRDDMENLKEELGDLLLQVLFHWDIAYDEGSFYPIEVTSALANKLIYRHPHIFSEKKLENSEEVVYNWNELKDSQREYSSFNDKLKQIPKLTGLIRSRKIQDKAAEIGFDWKDIKGPLNKVLEEYHELIQVIEEFGGGDSRVEEELGDLLFSIVNLSRFVDVDPELALNRTIKKFIDRFQIMEEHTLELNKTFEDMTLEELDNLWELAKKIKRH